MFFQKITSDFGFVALYLLYVIFCILYSSLFEWVLHRYVMHKPFLKSTYAYKAHAIVHHGKFKADSSYHANQENKYLIKMAWWNGPVLVVLATSLAIIPLYVGIGYGIWWPVITLAAVMSVYFLMYETFHWWMHLPEDRKLLTIRPMRWFFVKLNGHHLLHHKYPNKNFNVVFPFADLVLGTLLRRSTKAFPQPTGKYVPDVQPKSPALHIAKPPFQR